MGDEPRKMYRVIYRVPTERILYEVVAADPLEPYPGVTYATREEAESMREQFQQEQDRVAEERKPLHNQWRKMYRVVLGAQGYEVLEMDAVPYTENGELGWMTRVPAPWGDGSSMFGFLNRGRLHAQREVAEAHCVKQEKARQDGT